VNKNYAKRRKSLNILGLLKYGEGSQFLGKFAILMAKDN
jgi:hypothetical protein